MKSSPKAETNRKNAQPLRDLRDCCGSKRLATMTVTVMPGESEADLDELSQSIRNDWNPQGDHENFLVDQMISARWRLERLARYEEEAMNKAIDGPAGFITNEGVRRFQAKSAHRRVLDQIDAPNSIFDKLERYTRAAERAYSKAVKELQQHRANQAKTAKQNEATAKQNKAKEAELWLQSELAKLERTRITDPFAGLGDLPEQDEPNFDSARSLPDSAAPAS